jgi:hypothetical protein
MMAFFGKLSDMKNLEHWTVVLIQYATVSMMMAVDDGKMNGGLRLGSLLF